MFTNQLPLTNNQIINRSAKMESQLAVNRITDEVQNEYKREFEDGRLAGFSYCQSRDMAYDRIRSKFKLDGELLSSESGRLGNIAAKLKRTFPTKNSKSLQVSTIKTTVSKMKTCAKCHVRKPATEFNKHSKSPDGLQSYCKECAKTYAVERQLKTEPEMSTQESFTEVDNYGFTVMLNNIRVEYSGGEMWFVRTDGGHVFMKEDITDLLKLLERAEAKLAIHNGAN